MVMLIAMEASAEAAFSGVNGPIAYVCSKGPALAGKSNREICTITPGGTAKRLTTNDVADLNPDVSADGKRIYFERVPNCGGGLCPGDIWSMKLDGSGARRITATKSTAEGDPAIAPNGTRLVYVKGTPSPSAKLVLAKTSDGSTVKTLGTGVGPSYSPSGARIAFSQYDHCWDDGSGFCIGSYAIWSMKGDGTGKTMLTSDTEFADGSKCDQFAGCPETNGNPDYSPAGSLIAWDIFDSEAQNGYTYRMTTAGGAMTPLASDASVPGCPQHPAYSPDGTKVVFADGVYCDSGGNPPRIYTQSAAGGAPVRIADGFQPDWGPKP